MALTTEAFAGQSKRPGMVCGVSRLLDKLPEDDRAVLETVMADEDIAHATISRVLRDEGYDISGLTIGRHRNRTCHCGR